MEEIFTFTKSALRCFLEYYFLWMVGRNTRGEYFTAVRLLNFTPTPVGGGGGSVSSLFGKVKYVSGCSWWFLKVWCSGWFFFVCLLCFLPCCFYSYFIFWETFLTKQKWQEIGKRAW